jgi:hypothetical protein
MHVYFKSCDSLHFVIQATLTIIRTYKKARQFVSFEHTAMVFRLPTNTLEPFIPPPSQQVAQPRPWRGALVVSGMRPSDRSSAQTIRVTAVETDGEKSVTISTIRVHF